MKKLKKFNDLPLTDVSFEVEERFKKNTLIKSLIDIFDSNFWSSKVSVIGNLALILVILISTLNLLIT